MLRRSEDKEKAILNKSTSVSGKDTADTDKVKKRINNKTIENGDVDEEQPIENKKTKGYLEDPLSTIKRVD